MLAVLPHRLDHEQRRVIRNAAKGLYAALLAINKSVQLGGVVLMAATYLVATRPNGLGDCILDFHLHGPALLIGGEPQVAVRHEIYSFLHRTLLNTL